MPEVERVVVQGINMRTKHQRQVQSQGRTVNPGKVRFEAPVAVSNVMIVCKKCNKPTRVELLREDGKSKRVCKECNAIIDD
jgi:large subunit ribosomal protein L24